MPLFVLGLNHKTAPLSLRERLAFGPDNLPQALEGLQHLEGVRESCILSTCNRTELYCQAESPQVVGQWLAASANARRTWSDFRYRRFQFGFDRRQILIGVVFEQALLLGSECFALDAETQTFQVGQFEGEFLDFEFFGLQLCLVRRSLIHHVLCLRQEGGIKVQFGEFGEQIHGMDYTTQPH